MIVPKTSPVSIEVLLALVAISSAGTSPRTQCHCIDKKAPKNGITIGNRPTSPEFKILAVPEN